MVEELPEVEGPVRALMEYALRRGLVVFLVVAGTLKPYALAVQRARPHGVVRRGLCDVEGRHIIYGRTIVNSHHSDGMFGAIRDRIKSELLDDPRPGAGVSTLAIGLISGLIWFFLVYVLPGQSWWNAKFLVVAVCFVLWGVADLLPRGWRIVAAVLRAAVFVFLLGFAARILFDLLAAF